MTRITSLVTVESPLELVGRTPMINIVKLRRSGEADIFAKLEFMNICGSIKDRIGIAMIEEAESSGKLAAGGTVIEPTAGNTGIGVALAGIQKGYRVIIVMPEGYAPEKMALIRGLGAELVVTSKDKRMQGAIEKAKELEQEITGALVLNQFGNPANPRIHYTVTGPEIYEQMDGRVDAFVAGAGTGGSFTGIVRFLKEKNPGLLAVVADPPGSLFSGRPFEAPHRVEGIGNSFWPEVFDKSVIDEVITIEDDETYFYVVELGRAGLLAGSSSGCNYAAAKRVAERLGEGKRVVTLLPDSSERYLKKFAYAGTVDGEKICLGNAEKGCRSEKK
jgi:cysteine synthase